MNTTLFTLQDMSLQVPNDVFSVFTGSGDVFTTALVAGIAGGAAAAAALGVAVIAFTVAAVCLIRRR